jgi:GT2 family glycosyltransferase
LTEAGAAAVTRPRVRVGVVSHNAAGELERCLAALGPALGDHDADIVVVDNASSDASALRAARHGVRVIANRTDVGYAVALNQALAGSRPDVLVAVRAASQPRPGALARLIDTVWADPTIGLAVPCLVAGGDTVPALHPFPSVGAALRGREAVSRPDQPGWAAGVVHCIRAAALGRARPYVERRPVGAEDLELAWRLCGRGWRVVLDPGALVDVGELPELSVGALYDWYARTHGGLPARTFAVANVLGLSARLVTSKVRRRGETVRALRSERARHLRRVLRAR